MIATDAETGAVEWVFNTIPQRPRDDGWEIARDTWGDGQRAGGGVWTQPAIDLDLGLIYINTGNPSPDYDGSARPGANLFTNATVALDLETGALRWYYQAIHHDLWDWDHVTGPVLFDVAGADGETIRGVGAAGKNCLLYLWNRETGEPINPMVETPVPTATNVPGEVACQQVFPARSHRRQRQPGDGGRPRVPGRGRRRVLRVPRRDRRAAVPPPGAAPHPVEPDDLPGERQTVRHGDRDRHDPDLRAAVGGGTAASGDRPPLPPAGERQARQAAWQ